MRDILPHLVRWTGDGQAVAVGSVIERIGSAPRDPGAALAVSASGEVVFAYLVSEQGRPVTRDELAEALWGETPPARWEKALGVIASKLRALLGECGVDGAKVLTSAFGCYRLELPDESWVDILAAARGA